MIIWGWRSFVKTLAMLTLVCPKCHNPAAHRLVRRSRWFSLFFIPVIPLGSTHLTTCTFCGLTQKVSKESADQMVAAAQAYQQPPVEQLPTQQPPAVEQYPVQQPESQQQPPAPGYPQQ